MTQYKARREIGWMTIVGRALSARCPNCGEGKLLASYLKQVENCAVCGERYGHIRSDDAAPWLTVMVVGHIIVPLVFAAEKYTAWPSWVAISVWTLLALVLTLAVLPRAKTLFLSLIWATRAPGSETPEELALKPIA